MSTTLANVLRTALLETILIRLAPLLLLGAGGDTQAARQAALQMLAAYHPETEDELSLAANVIGFSLHALEALSQAAEPDQSLTRIIRLRGSAVSLSREPEKARRRLIQLQKARQQAVPAETQHEPIQSEPAIVQPTIVKPNAQSQTHERQQEELRLAASLKRAEARIAALTQAEASGQHTPILELAL